MRVHTSSLLFTLLANGVKSTSLLCLHAAMSTKVPVPEVTVVSIGGKYEIAYERRYFQHRFQAKEISCLNFLISRLETSRFVLMFSVFFVPSLPITMKFSGTKESLCVYHGSKYWDKVMPVLVEALNDVDSNCRLNGFKVVEEYTKASSVKLDSSECKSFVEK